MKRLVALCAALALTLVFAAPAAANSKVVVDEWDDPGFEEPINLGNPFIMGCEFDDSIPAFVCEAWACGDDTIYYGGTSKGSATLWYPKGIDTTDEAEYMPDGEAWPWKQGRVEGQGLDYFATGEDMTGKVVSGKYRWTTQMRDHYLGGDPDYVDDPETWTEQVTGKTWGIKAPGAGNLFFEAGNYRYKVIQKTPGIDLFLEFEELRPWKGNSNLDAEGLCKYFGYGYKEVEVVFPL